MNRILSALWNEPVVLVGVLTATAAALAAEGLIAAWIPVVVIAATAPILRHFVSPVGRSSGR